MFTSTGVLVSDPKANSIPNIGKWWLILACDNEIGRYYRETLYRFNPAAGKLQRPAWESHISVIRGEEPTHLELWGSFDGREIEFQYNPALQTNGEYYWLDVECEALGDIREALGLSRNSEFNLHLTVGRIS